MEYQIVASGRECGNRRKGDPFPVISKQSRKEPCEVSGRALADDDLVRSVTGFEKRGVCHPAVFRKSAEASDCKGIVKHSLGKERKERAKSEGRNNLDPHPPMVFVRM
jgi:hypothetical protein